MISVLLNYVYDFESVVRGVVADPESTEMHDFLLVCREHYFEQWGLLNSAGSAHGRDDEPEFAVSEEEQREDDKAKALRPSYACVTSNTSSQMLYCIGL